MIVEISFDLVMDEDMSFAEGTYRLPGGEWCVFIFIRKDVLEPKIRTNVAWESGVHGTVVEYPKSLFLNKTRILQVLSDCLDVREWREVRGPDSIKLR